MALEEKKREHWGSKIGFVLAAAGSAIGLGNVWKFPYITGMNGGAAFVVVYLICIVAIGLPIMLAEFSLGRKSQKDPVGAYKFIRPKGVWFLAGAMGVIAGFIILSYYSVVAGWTMHYIVTSLKVTSSSFTPTDADSIFAHFAANPYFTIFWHFAFMFLCAVVVIKGIQAGIERWNKILLPLLFVILVILVVRALTLKGSLEGVKFYLLPKFDQPFWGLSWSAVLIALGHAFFTLSLGMGAMITYGSYLDEDVNLASSAFKVVVLDTMVALTAGLALFPAIFAMGLKPDVGPPLIFNILPVVFSKMPGGIIFAALFFFLLFIAAFTSGISLLEVVAAYFIDEKGWSRPKAVITFSIVIFIIGIPCALSTGCLSNFKILGLTCFDFADYLAANIMLPLGGLLVSIFVGWVWGKQGALEEASKGNPHFKTGKIWIFMLRFVSPILVALVLLNKFWPQIIALFS